MAAMISSSSLILKPTTRKTPSINLTYPSKIRVRVLPDRRSFQNSSCFLNINTSSSSSSRIHLSKFRAIIIKHDEGLQSIGGLSSPSSRLHAAVVVAIFSVLMKSITAITSVLLLLSSMRDPCIAIAASGGRMGGTSFSSRSSSKSTDSIKLTGSVSSNPKHKQQPQEYDNVVAPTTTWAAQLATEVNFGTNDNVVAPTTKYYSTTTTPLSSSFSYSSDSSPTVKLTGYGSSKSHHHKQQPQEYDNVAPTATYYSSSTTPLSSQSHSRSSAKRCRCSTESYHSSIGTTYNSPSSFRGYGNIKPVGSGPCILSLLFSVYCCSLAFVLVPVPFVDARIVRVFKVFHLFANAVANAVADAVANAGMTCVIKLDNLFAAEKTSVLKLQIGLLGSARSLQSDLNRIAEVADTSTPKGLSLMLTETVLVLLRRHPEFCVSGYTSTFVKQNMDEGEKQFSQLSIEERAKFDEETLVNVNNIIRKDTSSKRSSGSINEHIVITILVAAEGVHKLPAIKSTSDLNEALLKFGSINTKETMAVEVLWTPQNENDLLSELELLKNYPALRLL